ncbi:MAG: serine/threonine protein kinase [Kofleriaceae bacterium]|nr:serine/threonine protein kinase [Kofleriaceae bacterium]
MDRSASIRLGSYQVRDRLGEGGGGQVFRAEGPAGPVAVKILAPDAELDPAARARFGREVRALAALAHPGLVPLLDHGVDDELGPYLVLPLLAGANLRAAIAGRRLGPEGAVLLAAPLADAVAALHAAGFVHRDVKPENAIGGPDGRITLIDLGLAWREGMTRHTESGAAVGTIGYMAPEQIEGRAVGAAVDVWALGVMLHEWVVGTRPFHRGRPAEEAAAALVGGAPLLTALDRRVDDELATLVARCLAAEPAARPTARALADALATWAAARTPGGDAERARAARCPAGYAARVAPAQARRLAAVARAALAAGQPFAALAACDRGLAHVGDDPELLALVAEIEATSAATATATIPAGGAGGPARGPRRRASRAARPWPSRRTRRHQPARRPRAGGAGRGSPPAGRVIAVAVAVRAADGRRRRRPRSRRRARRRAASSSIPRSARTRPGLRLRRPDRPGHGARGGAAAARARAAAHHRPRLARARRRRAARRRRPEPPPRPRPQPELAGGPPRAVPAPGRARRRRGRRGLRPRPRARARRSRHRRLPRPRPGPRRRARAGAGRARPRHRPRRRSAVAPRPRPRPRAARRRRGGRRRSARRLRPRPDQRVPLIAAAAAGAPGARPLTTRRRWSRPSPARRSGRARSSADAGGDDDRGRAQPVAAVGVRGLEPGQGRMPQPEDRLDLAAVGVGGQDQIDAITGAGGDRGVELVGDQDREVGVLDAGDQALDLVVGSPRRVAVGEERDRDRAPVVIEAAELVVEHLDPLGAHGRGHLGHPARAIDVDEVLVVAAHRERAEPAAGQARRARGGGDVIGAHVDPVAARQHEVGLLGVQALDDRAGVGGGGARPAAGRRGTRCGGAAAAHRGPRHRRASAPARRGAASAGRRAPTRCAPGCRRRRRRARRAPRRRGGGSSTAPPHHRAPAQAPHQIEGQQVRRRLEHDQDAQEPGQDEPQVTSGCWARPCVRRRRSARPRRWRTRSPAAEDEPQPHPAQRGPPARAEAEGAGGRDQAPPHVEAGRDQERQAGREPDEPHAPWVA